MDPTLFVPTSNSGDYRTIIPQHAHNNFPIALNRDDARSDRDIGGEIEAPIRVGSLSRRPFSKTLFGLKSNNTRSRPRMPAAENWNGRMFDYTQKYGPDEFGAEMGHESRFCRMYMDESELFDMERIESWRDALDVLLVFIGLFSAIVTTFVIQTSQALQPNYGQLTATLVYNLVLVQRALSNGTITSVPFPENPANPQLRSSQIEKWVNGLWFTSLTISLSTALVTVLTKQWLYRYMAQPSGTSKDRTRLRQFRFAGLEKYRVPMIIDLLPVALHIALALFLAGLALFLSTLDRTMTIIVIAISGAAYALYIVSAILPLFDPQCPYQSPLSTYLHHAKFLTVVAVRSIAKALGQCAISCIHRWVRLRGRGLNYPSRILDFENRFGEWKDYGSAPVSSLQTYERQAVLRNGNQLDIDAITWLQSTSSNPTVRDISFEAVVGLTPSDADTRRLIIAAESYIEQCSGDTQIVSCINGNTMPYIRPLAEDVPLDEEDGSVVFKSLILPTLFGPTPFGSRYPPGFTPAFSLADFLSPGPRSQLRLPLSVWKLCITMTKRRALDPVLVDRAMNVVFNWPSHEDGASCDSPATLADALRSSPHLHHLILDGFAEKVDVGREGLAHFYHTPLLLAMTNWAVRSLVKFNPETDSVWGDAPQANAFAFVVRSLSRMGFGIRLMPLETASALQDICAFVLAHERTFECTEIGWEAYLISSLHLRSLWDVRSTLSIPPHLFQTILMHLDRTPPPNADVNSVYRAVHTIPEMIKRSAAPGIFYRTLRERDELPLALATVDGDGSYRDLFWGSDMCKVAVFAVVDKKIDTNAAWAVEWVQYIDCPERLLFLFKRLLKGPTRWQPPPIEDLFTRVAPLLVLTRNSVHWGACFQSLINLLNDDEYISTIRDCDRDRRRHIFSILLQMQTPGMFPAVDLSTFIVPTFD